VWRSGRSWRIGFLFEIRLVCQGQMVPGPFKCLKWLAVCMVSAEMLNSRLLSTQAAGMNHLYFT
jgi:hypothetical protein